MDKQQALLNLIQNRRSIRKYRAEQVPDDLIKEIIDSGKHAASAFDCQPWEFIVIKDNNKIRELLSDRLQQKEPPYAINSQKYAEKYGIEKYGAVNPPPVLIAVLGNKKICPFLDSLLCSLSCCVENMMLAAYTLGLGTCWLYVYDMEMPETEDFVKEQLDLEDNFMVLCLLTLGYPDEVPLEKKMRDCNIKWL
ncbi:nitroreductase family protein [Patescibacteria group bacterium]|nr:nitroreductase family protein [Patescibacteria group bacterium]